MTKSIYLSILILSLSVIASGETTILGVINPYPIESGLHVNALYPSLNSSGRLFTFSTIYPLAYNHINTIKGVYEIYLYDCDFQQYELISVGMDGYASGDGVSSKSVISEDGRYVAFLSSSKKLIPGDTTDIMDPPIGSRPSIFTYGDCFVRDRVEGTTIRVNVSSEGEEATHGCADIDMSRDGRYIVFSSITPNLVANDTNDTLDIFVHDVQTQTTRLVSTMLSEIPEVLSSQSPSISEDGRFIAYHTYKDYGHDYITNYIGQIVVYDMQTDIQEIITKGWDGSLGNGYLPYSGSPRMSDDGRFIAFISTANNLLPNLPQSWGYVYLYNRALKNFQMISTLQKPPTGPVGKNEGFNAGGYKIFLSGDGRYVFWYESEINCYKLSIYRYDRIMDKIDIIVTATAPRFNEIMPWITQESACNYNGSVFLFLTNAYDLAPTMISLGYYLFALEIPILSNAGGWNLFR